MSGAERRATSGRGARRPVVLLVALLLFAWVSLYRFNALGGFFGGFDDDHFVQFAYAKQVQAGEQPLRDFQGGLMGARPSLTFELSAAAQRYLGNNLRSEAWLTVGAVALGAAVTFVAGSHLAPWPWALVTALLSALISPKLYSYPKVLVMSVAALLIVRYAARPAGRRLVLLSVGTAVAFLFRHDYAVYCGVGFATVLGVSHWGAWREGARRAIVYGLLTIALLGPSLGWVQHYVGLGEYLRNGLEMGRRDAERTDIEWPQPSLSGVRSASAALERTENTEAWLYYVFLATPLVALAVAGRRWARLGRDPEPSASALVALGLMTAVVAHYFLRGSLEARFGDMAPLVAVLGAALLAASVSRGGARLVPWLARAATALTVLAVTVAAIWSLQTVSAELRTGRLLESPGTVAEQTRRISQELVSLPAALRVSQADDRMEAADYLHRCTRPTDRVLILAYAPDVFAFSERLFAGGRATFVPGFYADERYSRDAIARLEAWSVPIALAEPEEYYAGMPLLLEYIRSTYADVGTVRITKMPDGVLRVLVRRGAVGRPLGPRGFPCFA